MSLINEALKRAEEEKSNSSQQGQVEVQNIPQPDSEDIHVEHSSSFSPLSAILAAVCLVSAGLCTWTAITTGLINNPQHASAQQNELGADSPDQTSSPDQTLDTRSEIERIIAKSLIAKPIYQPLPMKARSPQDIPNTHASAVESVGTKASEAQLTEETSPKQSAKPKPVEVRVVRTPSFKLSAIMHGSYGGTAVINQRFLRVGAVIDDAKVVSIGRHTVDLEFEGRKITLQMD